MARILVVDDEALMRTMVEVVCTRMGHEVLLAESVSQGLALGRQGVDVVLLDVWLPDGNGLEWQGDFAHLPGMPDVVIITGHGDGDAAEAALRSGAWEFLTKPLKVRHIEQCLRHVLTFRENRVPGPESLLVDSGHVLGAGMGMSRALKLLAQAAQSEVNVLLLGETGVGKEVFAKALYRNSARAAMPFVTVDCASLPENLVESQLFGHSRGAFTGADRAREGLLLSANKGTLFLDEVGDLPLAIQGAFLRAMELRRFRPVGNEREVSSDFRLVAATNRDIEGMAREGGFRADLLYRLQGMTIVIPPLRERRDEIPALARQAASRFCLRNDLPPKAVSDALLDVLMEYPWPGNVRELIHSVERACLAAGQGNEILPAHLPTRMRVDEARRRMGRGPDSCAADVAGSGAVGACRFGGAYGGGGAPASAGQCAGSFAGQSSGLSAGLEQASGRRGRGLAPVALHPGLPPVGVESDDLPDLRQWKARAEEVYVRSIWAASNGDARKAAGMAGVSRGHWYELMKKHGL